jgi:hypothetical protein
MRAFPLEGVKSRLQGIELTLLFVAEALQNDEGLEDHNRQGVPRILTSLAYELSQIIGDDDKPAAATEVQ